MLSAYCSVHLERTHSYDSPAVFDLLLVTARYVYHDVSVFERRIGSICEGGQARGRQNGQERG